MRALFARTPPVTRDRSMRRHLEAVLAHLDDADWLDDVLATWGADHLAHGITREAYGYMGECLVIALADALGAAWTPASARAWEGAIDDIRARLVHGAAEADTLVDYVTVPPPSSGLTAR
jgi:hemoglobin-like flavoprotein